MYEKPSARRLQGFEKLELMLLALGATCVDGVERRECKSKLVGVCCWACVSHFRVWDCPTWANHVARVAVCAMLTVRVATASVAIVKRIYMLRFVLTYGCFPIRAM